MEKKRMKSRERRGEITLAHIIMILLLVLGFVILLVFYYNIDWKGNLGTETCHTSVIFRASAGQVSEAAESYIPLKCRTEKFCLTNALVGKGDCTKDFGNVKGITTIRVHGIEQLEKFYAEEIFRCWQMMGEGKISLFDQYAAKNYGIGSVYPSCVICSRIAFDKDFNTEILEDMNLRLYMSTHKVPNKDYTYSQYLSGNTDMINIGSNVGGTNYQDLIDKANDLSKGIGEKGDFKFDKNTVKDISLIGEDNSALNKENSVIFMQIAAPEFGSSFKNALGALGLTMGTSFVLAPTVTVRVVSSLTNWWTLAVLAVAGIYQQGNVAYNRAVTAGYCSDVLTGSKSRSGCSIVRTVNYDVDAISGYCKNIESIP